MRPVCRFYLSSECKNPNCRFSHPIEYPVYIYAGPENDIHPDELRVNVVSDGSMAAQADRIWVENYQQFCQAAAGDVSVDIVENPDYFCMPFNVDAVSKEIEGLKRSGKLAPRHEGRGERQGRGYEGNRGYESRGFESARRADGNRGYEGSRGYDGNRNARYGSNRFDNKGDGRYSNRYDNNRYGGSGDNRAGGRPGGDKPYGSWGKPASGAAQPGGQRWGEGRQSESRAGGGWFGGRDAGLAASADPNGFERARAALPPAEERGNSPDYEYQNVPYHYK